MSFFVDLVGTINNKAKEWHMSQDDMASQWGCDKRTVNDYLEQLEELTEHIIRSTIPMEDMQTLHL